MDYISVKELAELKEVSVQSVNKLIRNGKITAEQRLHPKNNQLCSMIPIDNLPENLKEKYYRQKNKELGLLPELKEQPDSPRNGSGKVKKQKKPVNVRALDSFTEDERRQIERSGPTRSRNGRLAGAGSSGKQTLTCRSVERLSWKIPILT